MLIRVTQKMIDDGRKCDTRSCALAIAIQAVVKPEYTVEVGIALVWIVPFDAIISYHTERFPLPKVAIKFRRDFDSGRPVFPFTFELPIPEIYLRDSNLQTAATNGGL